MNSCRNRYSLLFIIMCIILAGCFCLGLAVGSADISVIEVIKILFSSAQTGSGKIIISIRLPRIIAAIILGGALSVSGYLLQIFFGNPIAGPYVLGISSGAKLFVALSMVFLLGKGIVINSLVMVIAAFIGSIIGYFAAVWQVNRENLKRREEYGKHNQSIQNGKRKETC